jgi:hypothetical protein
MYRERAKYEESATSLERAIHEESATIIGASHGVGVYQQT